MRCDSQESNRRSCVVISIWLLRRAAGCEIPVVVWDHCPERANGRDIGPILRYFSFCRSPKRSGYHRQAEQAELFKVKEADCRSCNDKNNFYGKGFQTVADIPFG